MEDDPIVSGKWRPSKTISQLIKKDLGLTGLLLDMVHQRN